MLLEGDCQGAHPRRCIATRWQNPPNAQFVGDGVCKLDPFQPLKEFNPATFNARGGSSKPTRLLNAVAPTSICNILQPRQSEADDSANGCLQDVDDRGEVGGSAHKKA